MHARAQTYLHPSFSTVNETEISERFQFHLIEKYGLEENMASEMSCEFIEMLQAVDADLSIFEKYFLL